MPSTTTGVASRRAPRYRKIHFGTRRFTLLVLIGPACYPVAAIAAVVGRPIHLGARSASLSNFRRGSGGDLSVRRLQLHIEFVSFRVGPEGRFRSPADAPPPSLSWIAGHSRREACVEQHQGQHLPIRDRMRRRSFYTLPDQSSDLLVQVDSTKPMIPALVHYRFRHLHGTRDDGFGRSGAGHDGGYLGRLSGPLGKDAQRSQFHRRRE